MVTIYNLINTLLDNESFKSNVKFSIKKFKPNEKILEQGKDHSFFYLIKKGQVRIIVNSEIKEENLSIHPGIVDLSENDIFGEFELFDDLPASADVVTVVESELVEIDIDSFRNYLENNSQIGYKLLFSILKILVSRLRRADKTIFNLFLWGIKVKKIDKDLD